LEDNFYSSLSFLMALLVLNMIHARAGLNQSIIDCFFPISIRIRTQRTRGKSIPRTNRFVAIVVAQNEYATSKQLKLTMTMTPAKVLSVLEKLDASDKGTWRFLVER
jgi:hypothetical protein